MTVNRTTLLDLPLPVTGTEPGTWGDITNNGFTQYMDIAIAGMSNLTSANFTSGALTIETTEGDSSADNISATSAQYAGFRVTSLVQNSTITVGNTGTSPARSYRLINADSTYTLTFKATGQTGITLQPGQSAVVAFNGTDYVIVGMAGAGTATDNAIARFDGTTGKIVQNSVVTIADSTGDIAGVGSITVGAGAAGTPSITTTGDTNTGIYFPAADTIAFTEGGVEAMRIDSSGNVGIGTNSPSSYGKFVVLNSAATSTTQFANSNVWAISNASNADSNIAISNGVDHSAKIGIYNGANLYFALDGSEKMRIDSSGNVGIGTTTPNVIRFRVKGSDSSSSYYALYAENSAPTDLLFARNDGLIGTGTAANSPYNYTTAGAANVVVNSAGHLFRSTSSLRYKTDIQDATHGLAEVMKLRSVTYKGKNDGDTTFGGLIAEEVHEAGLTEFIQYNKDGEPDALSYSNMVSLCIKAIQEQQALIESLTARVAQLEGNQA
jgi:hypothetical protein